MVRAVAAAVATDGACSVYSNSNNISDSFKAVAATTVESGGSNCW